MVPDAELTAEPDYTDAEPAAAVSAALAGDGHPAAGLVAATHGDWDRRTAVVDALATAATTERQWLRDRLADREGDPDATVVQAQTFVALAWQRRGAARARYTSRRQFGPLPPVAGVRPGDRLEGGRTRRSGSDAVGDARHRLQGARDPVPALRRDLVGPAGPRARPPARSRYVRDALDAALPWLDGEGAQHPETREDRAYAIYALHHNGRHDEAVAQFRKLGGHANGYVRNFTADVRRGADPVKQFAALRAQTCRKADRGA